MESSDRDQERFDEAWQRRRSIQRFVKQFEKYEPQLEGAIDELLALAQKLISTEKAATKSKTAASSFSAVGGVCTIAGLALAPFTAGTSTLLATARITFCVSGGAGDFGVDVFKSIDVNKVYATVETTLSKADNIFKELFSALNQAGRDVYWLHKFIISFKEESSLNFDPNTLAKLSQIKNISSLAKALVVLQAKPALRTAAKIACRGSGSKTVVKAIGKAAPVAMSKGARAAAGAMAGGLLVWDVKNIIGNANHLANGCKTKEAQEIQDAVDDMQSVMSGLKCRYEDMKKIMEAF